METEGRLEKTRNKRESDKERKIGREEKVRERKRKRESGAIKRL